MYIYFISDKTYIYKIAFYPANKTYLILNTSCSVVFSIQIVNSKQIVCVKPKAIVWGQTKGYSWGQTKGYNFGICCFSTKHPVLRSESKDSLASTI